MVLGNGLLANGCKALKDSTDVLVFASGVSNSKETNSVEFEKEFQLLKKNLNEYPDVKLIYFSTCSIFDASISGSPYINHKIAMEKYIAEHCKKFLIFRLPNVIGPTTNPNTFFNFFKKKITSGEAIYIQETATRYLIDVRDLTELFPLMIDEKSLENKMINVCFDNQMLVSTIIELYEEHLNVQANKVLVPGGASYKIENDEFIGFLGTKGIQQNNNYNHHILGYYLSLIEHKL